jgi:predicted dehydrogenase
LALNIALAGCGGMGLRHLHGLIEHRSRFDSLDLIAVCDVNESAARHLADVAEQRLGRRPAIHTEFDEMLRAEPLDLLDIVTDTRMHHTFAEAAFGAGLDVMTEKPMGITLKAARRMRDAAERANRVLSVAENYRRDPLCRLAKSLIEGGVIGTPRMAMDVHLGGGDTLMHNTAWRAMKSRGGGMVIDAGVHAADLLLFYLGDATRIYAETGLFEPIRYRRGMSENLSRFYSHRADDIQAEEEAVRVDAIDSGFGVVRFESGAICNFTISEAVKAHPFSMGTIHGSLGSMTMPGPRSGTRGGVVHLDGEDDAISGDELLALAPTGYKHDEITAAFFGEGPIASYDMPFEQADRTLLAIEYEELVRCAESRSRPEVDAEAGMKALALAYALLESGEAGRPVTLSEVMSGDVAIYQNSIDAENGV